MTEQEQRIRQFAYEIWQTEGCPDGHSERHWEMACKLVEAQQNGSAPSKPVAKPRKSPTKPVDVTAAAASAELAAGEQAGSEQPLAQPASQAKAPKAAKPAKAAAAAKGNGKPKPTATEAAEGTPTGVKKTRTSRAKKES